MASLFGHKWVSSFGTEIDPDRVWAATLHGLSEAQISAGLRAVAESGAEWPPGAPEFRQMCLNPSQEPWETKRIRLADQERAAAMALPKPPTDHERSRATGHAVMANIRNLMHMAPRADEPDAAA